MHTMDNSALQLLLTTFFRYYSFDNFLTLETSDEKYHIYIELKYLRYDILERYTDAQLTTYIIEILIAVLKPNYNLNNFIVRFSYRTKGNVTLNLATAKNYY